MFGNSGLDIAEGSESLLRTWFTATANNRMPSFTGVMHVDCKAIVISMKSTENKYQLSRVYALSQRLSILFLSWYVDDISVRSLPAFSERVCVCVCVCVCGKGGGGHLTQPTWSKLRTSFLIITTVHMFRFIPYTSSSVTKWKGCHG